MKNKPGPKPNPESPKARGKTLSFPASMADFLDSCESPSPFMQRLLARSNEYKQYLKKIKSD